MRKAILLAFLGIFANFASESPSTTFRSCPGIHQGPPCAEVWQASAVFVGTAVRVSVVPYQHFPAPDYQEFQKLTAVLKVDEVFRGEVGKEVVFETADCYFPFKEGETYLVYAGKEQDGKFVLQRSVSRTRLISEAAEDLAYLRGLPAAPNGGRIFGNVFDHRQAATLRVLAEPYVSDKPMVGIRISARSGDRSFATVTDGTGFYEFTNLPEGKYTVRADLPAYLSGSQQIASVFNKGCAPLRLSIQATGVIAGRLVDGDGKPIRNAVVTIFSAEGVTEEMLDLVKPGYTTRDITDNNGRFSFVRLPGDRYFLAVNLINEERSADSPAAELPRMFYPGVREFRSAKVIALDDGKELKDLEFKLSANTNRR